MAMTTPWQLKRFGSTVRQQSVGVSAHHSIRYEIDLATHRASQGHAHHEAGSDELLVDAILVIDASRSRRRLE